MVDALVGLYLLLVLVGGSATLVGVLVGRRLRAGDVVGLAAAWVQHSFARPGVRFVPVVDIEPVVTALAWRPGAPNRLVDSFLAVADEHLSDASQAAPPG